MSVNFYNFLLDGWVEDCAELCYYVLCGTVLLVIVDVCIACGDAGYLCYSEYESVPTLVAPRLVTLLCFR